MSHRRNPEFQTIVTRRRGQSHKTKPAPLENVVFLWIFFHGTMDFRALVRWLIFFGTMKWHDAIARGGFW